MNNEEHKQIQKDSSVKLIGGHSNNIPDQSLRADPVALQEKNV